MKRFGLPLFILGALCPVLPAAQEVVIFPPACEATAWVQEGPLNSLVKFDQSGADKNYACGCDPLAWGQIFTYHALHHGFPAAGWTPTPVTGYVRYATDLGTYIARTTMSGPYDWEKIRDQAAVTDAEGKTTYPVGRLMWDLGILGGAIYAYDTKATVGTRGVDYFGYAGRGHSFTEPLVNAELQPYWEEMLRTILRTSLQAQAPLLTSINLPGGGGHMIVTDGYRVDADGTERFHVDYALSWMSNGWKTMAEMLGMVKVINGFVYPTDLGGIIAGRVALTDGSPVAGATVVISNGAEAHVLTTDAQGAYCLSGLPLPEAEGTFAEDLPRVPYTVTLLADGFEPQTRSVALAPYVDDDLQKVKQEAYEDVLKGGNAPADWPKNYTFPLVVGSALADFTLTPRLFFAPGASGSGRSWADPAALSAAALADRVGYACYLAAGTYTLSSTLVLPAGATLSGGYDPETGLADPFATPTELVFNASSVKDRYVALAEGARLCGVTLSGSADVGSALYAESGLAAKPSATAVTFGPTMKADYYAQQVSLTCCRFDAADRTVQLEGCDRLHCSFLAYACEDKEGQDLGGNRFLGSTDVWRPTGELPCPDAGTAGHTCPASGLDGRPLNQTRGAFGALEPGYSLSLH